MVMSRGEREKFECDVDFEEEIDLADLYTNIKGIDKEESTKYTLHSGTILYGSHGHGHTVAFCKHFDEEYYIFNDSTARKSSFDEIKNSKIYLLFYKKI
jgi:ubiquitin C-terminal hydrolase